MGLTPLYHLFVMHWSTMQLKLFAAWVRGLFSQSLTIAVHPSNHHRLGIMWEGTTYVDRCLPFGLRSVPKIFSAFSDALAWIFGCAGLVSQVHYLYDFLFLELPCSPGFFVTEMVSSLCTSLGVPLSTHKTEGLSTCLVFLGILVDTVHWELRLPDDKLQLLSALIQAWSHRSACQRRELESFLGHLSHAATVIRQGRPFLCDLFQLWSVARQPHHFVRLTIGAKADILWFEEVEWEVLLPTGRPIGSRVHRCIWVIWMQWLPADRALVQACLAM